MMEIKQRLEGLIKTIESTKEINSVGIKQEVGKFLSEESDHPAYRDVDQMHDWIGPDTNQIGALYLLNKIKEVYF